MTAVARILLLLAAVTWLLAVAPASHAATRSSIIRDCEDDSRLSGTYTARELRDARNNLPSDTDAYSDCRDILGAALAASAARGRSTDGGGSGNALEGGGLGSGAGSGGGVGVTGGGAGGLGATGLPPAPPLDIAPGAAPIQLSEPEKRALRDARGQAPEVDARGLRTQNGVRGVVGQSASATVPTPLAVVLVLLGVTVVLAAVPYLRRRVLGRRPA